MKCEVVARGTCALAGQHVDHTVVLLTEKFHHYQKSIAAKVAAIHTELLPRCQDGLKVDNNMHSQLY